MEVCVTCVGMVIQTLVVYSQTTCSYETIMATWVPVLT